MKAKWILIGACVALATAVSGLVWSEDAGGPAPGTPPAQAGPEVGPQWKWMARLTPEQRQQVQDKVQELRQQGKTEAEIHAAVAEMLQGWGVKVPGLGPAAARGRWLAQLTPEQRAQVLAKAKELKAQGKTPQEIRAAVAEMLKGWGDRATGTGRPRPGERLVRPAYAGAAAAGDGQGQGTTRAGEDPARDSSGRCGDAQGLGD